MLQVLYKLKTAKVFERARAKEEKPSTDIVEEDPFAIQTLSWCPESRMLCVAGVSAHVIVYRFSKQEVTTEVVQVRQWSCLSCKCCGFKNLCPFFLFVFFLFAFRMTREVKKKHHFLSLLFCCSSWRCGCSASLARVSPPTQAGIRPLPNPPLQLPPAHRRASPPLLSPPPAAPPQTDRGTT